MRIQILTLGFKGLTASIFYQILSTNSLGTCMEISEDRKV